MSERPSQVIVLAEDARTESFVRRYLVSSGISRRSLRFVPRMVGRGAGEQFVRATFPRELTTFRSRQEGRRAATGLIAVIDADRFTAAARHGQLREALAAGGVPDRTGDEAVAILVPNRNIETWIVNLLGAEADESHDYKSGASSDELNAKVKPAAEQLWRRVRTGATDGVVPSLVAGITELRTRRPAGEPLSGT